MNECIKKTLSSSNNSPTQPIFKINTSTITPLQNSQPEITNFTRLGLKLILKFELHLCLCSRDYWIGADIFILLSATHPIISRSPHRSQHSPIPPNVQGNGYMPKVYINVTKHDPGMWDMIFAKSGNIHRTQTWFFMP